MDFTQAKQLQTSVFQLNTAGLIYVGIKIISKNRKASHEYELLERYEAGIELKGTEVKSLRLGKVNLSDGWVDLESNQAFLRDVSISPYSHGNLHNHFEKRTRRLLLHKSEIKKLAQGVQEKGLTLIPTSIYFKDSFVKIELTLARGKKLYDKRESTKTRDANRQMQRALSQRNR